MYISSAEVVSQYEAAELLWLACPLLIYWFGRIILLANRGMVDDDPVLFAVRDKVSWIVGIGGRRGLPPFRMNGRSDSATVTVAIRYAAFAALATFINVATQVLTLTIYEGRYGLQVAMAGGTVTGLVTKYLLDRKWIFRDRTASLSRNAARFVGYATTGVLTTSLFWAVELGFAQLGGRRLAAFHRRGVGARARVHC